MTPPEPDADELLTRLAGGQPARSDLATLLDVLPDAIILVDHDGVIQHASARLTDLTGYAPDDVVGRAVEDLVPNDRRADHAGIREGFQADPHARPMGAALDTEILRADGTVAPVDISLGPVVIDGAAFTLAAIRDGRARRATEDAMRGALEREQEASEKLRGLDTMRTAFMRAVSHDLRSPLASLMGLAMTLDDHLDTLDPAQTHELLGRVVANGRRLEQLLTDLLDLDRYAQGSVDIDRADTDLVRLLATVLDDLGLAEPGRVTLEVPATLTWAVDASAVGRILTNLISNARKHGGTDQPVTVRVTATDTEATISVEDHGPGVPDDEKTAIFEPFVRGADATSAGTGVGLSLVAQFAQLHGGRAWVEDTPGGGATFFVTLPREGGLTT